MYFQIYLRRSFLETCLSLRKKNYINTFVNDKYPAFSKLMCKTKWKRCKIVFLSACILFIGNHGEDVKELYYYQDSSPTHSYMKSLYKYAHKEYPYSWLIEENRRRGVHETEFELLDTGLYFIVYHSCFVKCFDS